MAMYVQLLRAALEDQQEAAHASTDEELLAELVARRRLLPEHGGTGPEASRMLDAVAGQVAYDASLVQVCTRLGISSDLESYAAPARERLRLETALAALGLVAAPH